ncbi:hypothetical protein BASA81_007410 [Batrachochytrium salamandrivorans]|nr:hypothetical protein BASA81_007410 [Batrachochytrium salamandrivorans]
MFRRAPASQVDELDRPLLDSDASSTPIDALPISPNTAVFGTRNAYAPLVSDEEDARVRSEQANRVAMERQHSHQASFQQEMSSLEQQVIREGRERAQLEKDDHALALQLAAQEQASPQPRLPPPALGGNSTLLMVTVPPGLIGGQMMGVAVPGLGRNLNIVVPRGLQGGDTFHFRVPTGMMQQQQQQTNAATMKSCLVQIPSGLVPGSTFQVILPNHRNLLVVIPPGTRDGDSLRIQYDDNTGSGPAPSSAGARPRCRQPTEQELAEQRDNESLAVMESIEQVRETPEQRSEREAFLAALPEDMRAEVLAQETAQKRRLSAYAPAPPANQSMLTAEQREFVNSLPEEIRDEVERDLLGGQANVPPPSTTFVPSAPPLIDVWGGSFSSPAPTAPTPPVAPTTPAANSFRHSSAPPPGINVTTPPPALDMFQNLAVRGVGGTTSGGKKKTEEI